MLINKLVQLAMVAATLLWESRCGAAPSAAKFCGRQLGEIMSRVCQAYNSPSWDMPTVVEQTGSLVRRRRHLGIADECCTMGCTWEQLSKYCSVSAYSESPLDDLEAHMIADRSAEQASGPASPAIVGNNVPAGTHSGGARREVGRARSRGYGRARARGRRCWCRRKRRSGRRRTSLMDKDETILMTGKCIRCGGPRKIFSSVKTPPNKGPRKKCSSRCSRSRHRVASANVGPNSQH